MNTRYIDRMTAACAPAQSRLCQRKEAGFTLVELLVVIAVIGILISVGIQTFSNLKNDSKSTAYELSSFYGQARNAAMTNTRAYRLLINNGALVIQTSLRCTDTTEWTVAPFAGPEITSRVTLSTPASPNNITCFDSRGLAPLISNLQINDTKGHIYFIQPALGGTVRVIRAI